MQMTLVRSYHIGTRDTYHHYTHTSLHRHSFHHHHYHHHGIDDRIHHYGHSWRSRTRHSGMGPVVPSTRWWRTQGEKGLAPGFAICGLCGFATIHESYNRTKVAINLPILSLSGGMLFSESSETNKYCERKLIGGKFSKRMDFVECTDMEDVENGRVLQFLRLL